MRLFKLKYVILFLIVNSYSKNSIAQCVCNGPVTPAQYRDMLGVGIDVDWAKTSSGMAAYNLQSVIDFKNRGINHVRIRVANDMSISLLNHLETIVTDCLSKNLIPIVAYQADAFKNNPNNNSVMDSAITWWDSTANRLKKYGENLAFNLLIECTDSLNNYNNKLLEYYEKVTTIIRVSNPTRILIIGPRKISDPEYLCELVMPTQANGYIMAEWHFYASGPSKTNANKLWTTGTDAEKKIITDKIARAYAWQSITNIPTWVGAWMPADFDGTDNTGFTSSYTVSEQVAFANFISCKLKEKGIPYAVNSDTKYYDRTTNQWYSTMAPVVNEFLNPTCQ